MRLLLPAEDSLPGRNDRWVLLPGLCCHAAGGEPEFAKVVSAAWFLLYLAGHLVDNVEDNDETKEIALVGGPASAINVANGYFLTAALMLNELTKIDYAKSQAHFIRADFYNTILVMTSAQHRDVNSPQFTLNQWWQVAEAKTGSFFSLACRSGARLGTDDAEKIESYSKFGFHLGLMLQIQDDIEDLQTLMDQNSCEIPQGFKKSLTAAYAFDVLPESNVMQLKQLLDDISSDPEEVNKVIRLLDQCGAGLYLLAEMDRHYALGVEYLKKAEPLSHASDELMTMIGGLKLK